MEDKIRKALQRTGQPVKDARRLTDELRKLELKIKEFSAKVDKLKKSRSPGKKSKS